MAKKLPPIHPGEQLREEFMIPLGLSSNALALALHGAFCCFIHVTPRSPSDLKRRS